jgi:hypothetical protein
MNASGIHRSVQAVSASARRAIGPEDFTERSSYPGATYLSIGVR